MGDIPIFIRALSIFLTGALVAVIGHMIGSREIEAGGMIFGCFTAGAYGFFMGVERGGWD